MGWYGCVSVCVGGWWWECMFGFMCADLVLGFFFLKIKEVGRASQPSDARNQLIGSHSILLSTPCLPPVYAFIPMVVVFPF